MAMTAETILQIELLVIDSMPLAMRSVVYYAIKSLFWDCERNLSANDKVQLLTADQETMYKNVKAKCCELMIYLEDTTQPNDLQLLQHFAPKN